MNNDLYTAICNGCGFVSSHQNNSDLVHRFYLFDPFSMEDAQKYTDKLVGKIKDYRKAHHSDMYDHGVLMQHLIQQYEDDKSLDPNEYWKHHQDELKELLVTLSPSNLSENIRTGVLIPAMTSNENDRLHCFYELIQNADDVDAEKINITENDGDLIVSYEEKTGMNFYQVVAMCSINDSTKANDADTIGEKGRGFKTVFMLTNSVEVHSGGYHFAIHVDRAQKTYDIRMLDSDSPSEENITVIRLRINDSNEVSSILAQLQEKYGLTDNNETDPFNNCPILFLRNIRSLNIAGGTIEYSFSNGKDGDGVLSYSVNGKPKHIPLFKRSFPQEFTPEELASYPDRTTGETTRYTVDIITPVSKERTGKGRLFVYLPTETSLSVPVLVNMPAFLNDSRKHLGMVADSNNASRHIPWNIRLLTDLLTKHLKSFYDELKQRTDTSIYNMLPDGDNFLSSGAVTSIDGNFREYFAANYDVFRTASADGFCTAKNAALPTSRIIFSASQSDGCGGLYTQYYDNINVRNKALISYPHNDADKVVKAFIKEHIDRFDRDISPADRTAALNACLDSCQRREAMFRFFFCRSENGSWEHTNEFSEAEKVLDMRKLNIYPVKCSEGTDYTSIDGKLLFSGEGLVSPFAYSETEKCYFLLVDELLPQKTLPITLHNEKFKASGGMFPDSDKCTADDVLNLLRFMRANDAEHSSLQLSDYARFLMTSENADSRWSKYSVKLAEIAFSAKEMNK